MMPLPEKTIFLIPVYNEEANVKPLLEELRGCFPSVPVCFINDCSQDNTEKILKSLECDFLSLPCNLGVGGGMQAGFRYAYKQGYDYAIRIDGDGQHPPSESEIPSSWHRLEVDPPWDPQSGGFPEDLGIRVHLVAMVQNGN